MKIIKLTQRNNVEILVNFQNVTFVEPEKEGSLIHTIRESGYNIINVKESIDEIMQKLER
jgi:hypothetical protein